VDVEFGQMLESKSERIQSLFTFELNSCIVDWNGSDQSPFREDVTELYKLWDLAIAFGAHMHAYFLISIILLYKNEINKDFTSHPFPWPTRLKAAQVAKFSFKIIQLIRYSHHDLYCQLLYFPFYIGE